VPSGQERDERELDGILLPLEGGLDGVSQHLELGKLLGDAGRSGHNGQNSTPASP
jgi:hypothetical protein